MGEPHIIEVFCCCDDVENCLLEKYISDVRILMAEISAKLDGIEATA